jgi:hypothetical protein
MLQGALLGVEANTLMFLPAIPNGLWNGGTVFETTLAARLTKGGS